MKNAKLILVFILLVAGLTGLFAANATVAFKDPTTTTYDLVNPEYMALNGGASYPAGSGNTTNRWRVFAYLSTDGVIDPLGTDGLPTGNDTYLANLNLNFSPGTGHTLNISGFNVLEATWMGGDTWCYLRIFNAIDQANATKYMTFFAPYGPITAGGVLTISIMPTYGWDITPAWKLIAPAPADTYQLTVTSSIPGIIATGGTAAVGQATPYVSAVLDATTTLVGSYSMTAIPGGTWDGPFEVTPADFVGGGKSGKALLTKVLNFTWTPNPPDVYNYTLNVAGDAGYSVTGPTGTMPFPAVFVAPDTDEENELIGTYTPSAAPANFHWEPASIEVTGGMFNAAKAQPVQGSRSASKATYNYVTNIEFALVADPPTYDYPQGQEEPLWPGITITMIGGNANNGNGHPPTDSPNPGFIPEHIQIFNLIGAGPWQLQFNTDLPWVWVVGYGVFPGPGIVNVNIPATKDQEIEVQFGSGGDPTLPVELSSFTATLTATYFVKLTWVSQSETGLLGYRVYRNTSNDQATALMITPTMVAATNTSSTQTYSLTDNEVSIGSTYWYWLESVDYGTSQFHGPVSVIVEGEVPPVIPTQTAMRNAYPNPFKVDGRTNIVVDVKADDAGSVTIYNILGQAVKTYNVLPGTNNITWNGRDNRGNVCGSGIYFYKLSTPSTNQTKKMVIVK